MKGRAGGRGPNTSLTRRAMLAALGGAATVGLAGCLGGGTAPDGSDEGVNTGTGGTDTRSEGTDTTATEPLPTPVRGDPDAGVTVLVFEDFACPHCRDYSLNVAPDVFADYADPGAIRYEFHDFPIPVDPQVSWNAACAARAVQARADAATFFEYAHALFENQSRLGPEVYAELADGVGLDGAAIRESATAGEYRPTVEADRQYGQERGVQGTPTVAVDGRVVRPTYEAISAAIEDARPGTETP